MILDITKMCFLVNGQLMIDITKRCYGQLSCKLWSLLTQKTNQIKLDGSSY
jgi:hypothetical protein